jgi:Fur family transcriptional regulator, ferric uptake regulator
MANEVDALSNAITENGYRLTAARKTVIQMLVKCGGHISADDLATQIRAEVPQVGRMTVFRTLELLAKLGMIQPIYQGTGAAHYVLMHKGSHHHLICTRCHRIIDFDECREGELAHLLGQQFNFQVQSHMLEVYGVCEDCR